MTHATPGVFTRNHLHYLRAAAARNKRYPERLTTFRSDKEWTKAAVLLEAYGVLPVYLAVIGEPNRISYIGRLRRIDLHPHERKSATRDLLRYQLPATRSE